MDRPKGIGCSEIAACMGLSRWQTPLELWAIKTGKLEKPDLSDKEYVELGTELEDFVCRKFERKSGMKVRRDSKTYVHPDYDFFFGHIDRRVVGEDAILEAKTASAWKVKEWQGDDIPQEYVLQLMGYLILTGKTYGYIACLIGGQRFVWKRIEYNPELAEKIIESVRHFWHMHVLTNNPPIAVGEDSNILLELYPQNTEELVQVDTLESAVAQRQELSMHIKNMENEKDDIESRIKQVIGNNAGVLTPSYKVMWNKQLTTRLNYDQLKADGIYDKYTTKKELRVLRVYKNKEKK